MPLVLQIENVDRLPDGGPLRIVVGEQGCQVGRATTMHWVLPDPTRLISGHHFDITYAEGGWWLTDRSTNGTFLQGSRYRLDQPWRLRHLDRFQVGHYLIVAQLEEPVHQSPDWGAFAPMPAPAPPVAQPLTPPPSFPAQPAFAPPAFAPPPGRLPGPPGDFAEDFIANPLPPAAPVPPQPVPPSLPQPQLQAPPLPPVPAVAAAAVLPPTAALAPQQPAAAPLAGPLAGASFLQAFCTGAGLDPAHFGTADPEVLAAMLGRSLRAVASEVMTQLQLRAAAKQFTRGGDRTMRQADHNNPLKFMPDVEQAMEAMFLRPRAGFLQGPEALAEALIDLRRHQVALFAALQPALQQLLGDLAPEEIEAAAAGGLLGGSRKAQAWELYIERWDGKTAPHENGILDAFLAHFAAAYMDSITTQAIGLSPHPQT
ncbi:FHA domain protein [Rhodobacter viridis]|uniref:FHA domain protein n=1 Tax=Rhodobacter viridis TaxID=1054202 RepID=A0A318U5X3_9RHOB|nr:type VI secretion system-associated FHA domain protein TagH [Rhodobacter viridis]PYF09870.1 FHA domain protein [Rhodobacter viridis]